MHLYTCTKDDGFKCGDLYGCISLYHKFRCATNYIVACHNIKNKTHDFQIHEHKYVFVFTFILTPYMNV